MAFTSFDVDFNAASKKTSSEATGVSGKMTFSFSKNPLADNFILDLSISNTTKLDGNPSGNLTAFAFNVPGATKPSPDFKLVTYEPLSSGFGDLFGATTNGKEANVVDGGEYRFPAGTPRTAPYAPFNNFTFCARDDGNNCHGGSGNTKFGIADGITKSVRFTIASNRSDINTASLVAQSFFDLFDSIDYSDNGDYKNAPIALRFQSVTTASGARGKSDKVAGVPKRPPQAPSDEVPGPVPMLGAATAFAFSRRLRRRIAASCAQKHPTV
ncbi:hypothetical protein VB738_00535 [Cyanobium gracile UHCC 0139]|uniref:PEP-CTERM sorting domain-containing protein n=1 Tax=Cyanobium gracile UHCC 0139 TaxID=3110308 RepID=A0ABU5RNR7_9CYAN|nr:hypothetical protein [Cyanobium gracile]MEA5389733.1 hypothetical protein [Cyanobium gracile UHCC 0139]